MTNISHGNTVLAFHVSTIKAIKILLASTGYVPSKSCLLFDGNESKHKFYGVNSWVIYKFKSFDIRLLMQSCPQIEK